MALVEVEHLSVDYRSRDLPPSHAVRDVSFDIAEGEFVGLLGESGCGKSTLGNAMLRLLDKPAHHAGGSVRFDGDDLFAMSERDVNKLRWREIATVFQSSMNALNPVLRIEKQFHDAMDAHGWSTAVDGDRHARIREVLGDVELDADRVMRSYPHELSGGMRQRVVLALALVLRPRFVLLDEPTTGLDVLVQRSIVELLRRIQREQGFTVLFISHDLGTVLEIADRVMVMYAGEIVESRPSAELAADPLHPYSHGLLGSFDDPRAEEVSVAYIAGRPPALTEPPPGCPFAPRCPSRMAACDTVVPTLEPAGPVSVELGTRRAAAASSGASGESLVRCHLHTEVGRAERAAGAELVAPRFAEVTAWASERVSDPDRAPLVVVEDLVKTYDRRRGLRKETVEAVKGVSFTLAPGQVRALVGQSGSGKSTIAKLLTRNERATSGTLLVDGVDPGTLRRGALREYRSQVQMVFQDPFAALNPTKTIGYSLGRPLRNYLGLTGDALHEQVLALLESVGLSPAAAYVDKLPHQLSGGQRQRVVVARAMAPRPRLLIADEPISMLDVSIRAEILELLADTVREQDVAMLYITHDLLSARLLADEIMVMRSGEIVEQGPTVRVVRDAQHEYTRALLDAIPNPERGGEPAVVAP
ncbi:MULTISPECIES: ABC transporter ATP-binding protein [unclassified Isoptericola]|uniref:ABC transporter ATP-binding protein n=1 Tax=unclassified Isoptericola TaxID=2623355 RepID=UPI00364970B1